MNLMVKIGLANIRIHKESGNLYVKNKEGNSEPIMYGAYSGHAEQLNLRGYMNLKSLNLEQAAAELLETGAVLLGSTFEICFYKLSDANRFIEKQLKDNVKKA